MQKWLDYKEVPKAPAIPIGAMVEIMPGIVMGALNGVCALDWLSLSRERDNPDAPLVLEFRLDDKDVTLRIEIGPEHLENDRGKPTLRARMAGVPRSGVMVFDDNGYTMHEEHP